MGSGEPRVSVRPSAARGGRANPKRRVRPVAGGGIHNERGNPNRVGQAGLVEETDSGRRAFVPMSVPRAQVEQRSHSVHRAANAANVTEPALNVIVVYQDSVTRHWAASLLDRLGQLLDTGCIRPKSWKLADLTRAFVFAEAVHAAAEADVLVVSVRDAGELPPLLNVWIDAWIPQRAGRTGTLVALIGVPARPDALAGRAHGYLESIARQAGLDFLPHERKLLERALPRPEAVSLVAGFS